MTATVDRPVHDAPSGGKVPLVEMRNVSKSYGNITALKDISLRVHPGEVTGILGDNGAGKSTLIKIIAGYHPQTDGELLVDGEAVKFNAPTSPNSAFIMADGVGDNAAGDLAFGGFVVKNNGKVSCFAVNCSHLGCPVGLNEKEKSFDCPCHGSRFRLDGQRFAGPAPGPLSHLTWKQGTDPGTIEVDGIVLGF